ncbi:MAG: hypothetical protein LBT33_06705 [Spirochaetia bacterium]|jgi:hypothetical protein|nr:hypothetical protein [Spirochaetia bacterium]
MSVVAVFVVCAGSLFALDVAEDELRIGGTIRFESNEGVPDKVETVAQIRGIGAALGRSAGSPERGYYGRYRLLHVVDPSQKDLFDADILVLERSATVDHIRNLRYIIGGYLAAAYGYSQADADLLARFVTVYNAVYRGNMEYFGSKYKQAVIGKLDAARAGLSTNWRDWPGGTEILVPLSDATAGSLSAVDTGAITDRQVIEEVRKQEDKGIESRKDIVDLKERQIEEQEKKTGEQKQAVQEERRQAERREKETEAKLAEVREQKKTAEEKTPASREEAKALEQEKANLAKQEDALQEQKTQVEEDKKAVTQKEADIAAREARTEEKKEEVRQDRREIARDQEEVLQRDSLAAVRGIPFIKVGASAQGRLLLVDPETGEVLADSPEQAITVRAYEAFGGGLAVILQREGAASGKLAVLERGSLKEKISAREEVYPQSYFQVNGSEIFAVMRDQGKWYLGKYDANLALLARSRTEVNPETFILFSNANVFVEDTGGKVVPLRLGDMAEDLGAKP